MKKTIVFLSALITSLVILSSCSKPTMDVKNEIITTETDKPIYYTVTFDSDGGTTIKDQTVEEGNTVIEPKDPTKEGFKFSGWFLNDKQFDFSTPIRKNIKLKAKWETISYIVSFDSNGGNPINEQTIARGQNVIKPSDPIREGYDFEGWFYNDELFDFTKPIYKNITLKAKWNKKQFNITFNLAGGTINGDSQPFSTTIEYEGIVRKPSVDPIKDGYEFIGWYNNSIPYDFYSPITSDLILTARWEISRFTVTFVYGGSHGNSSTSISVDKNELVPKPSDPKGQGQTFKGWYLNDVVFDFENTRITSSITLQGKWYQDTAQNSYNFICASEKTRYQINFYRGTYSSQNLSYTIGPINPNFNLEASTETITINLNSYGYNIYLRLLHNGRRSIYVDKHPDYPEAFKRYSISSISVQEIDGCEIIMISLEDIDLPRFQ